MEHICGKPRSLPTGKEKQIGTDKAGTQTRSLLTAARPYPKIKSFSAPLKLSSLPTNTQTGDSL
jgi:hypothetical protein